MCGKTSLDQLAFTRPSAGEPDPIAAMIETIDPDIVTGTLPAPEDPQ